jgi:SAM-dependent methyltransferase
MLERQRARFAEHYRTGATPWDTRRTPPEVHAFWASGRAAPHGIALDLGCGPGTNVMYLARLGLRAVGVDYVLTPLLTGLARLLAAAPGLAARAHFVQGDVTCLPFTGLGATYALDVGCCHSLPLEYRDAYVAGLAANLAPGAWFQMYAFDRVAALADDPERWFRGLDEGEATARFGPHFGILEIETATPDPHPCKWYLLRKAEQPAIGDR